MPPSEILGQEVDRLQRSMVRVLLRVRPSYGEDWKDYHDRVSRSVDRHLDGVSRWSSVWFKRAQDWHKHVMRHPESFEHKILSYRSADWLRQRRLDLQGNSAAWNSESGRTDTRSHAAYIFPRWEEAIRAIHRFFTCS